MVRLIALTGGMANAETRQVVTQYFFTVPADMLEIPLRIEASRMRDLLASEALWSKERGLVYHVDAGLDAGTTRTVFRVGYGTDPDKVEAAGRLIAEDLRAMGTTPVGEPELTQAKILLLRQMPLAESSLASIAAGLLARSERGLPLDEPTWAAPRIRKITAGEVQAAFARWIRPEAFMQVNLGPA